jgi:hypothetical protein
MTHPEDRAGSVGSGNEVDIMEGESMTVIIPKEGVTTTIKEDVDRDGRKFNRAYVELLSPAGKPIRLRCSETLSKKVHKASLMNELPVKITISRKGSTRTETRYEIVVTKDVPAVPPSK